MAEDRDATGMKIVVSRNGPYLVSGFVSSQMSFRA